MQIEQGPAVYEAVAVVVVVVVEVPKDAEDRLVASSVGVIDKLAGSWKASFRDHNRSLHGYQKCRYRSSECSHCRFRGDYFEQNAKPVLLL